MSPEDRNEQLLSMMTRTETSLPVEVAFEAMREIVREAGITIFENDQSRIFGWDGQSISIWYSKPERGLADLCHEFAHVQASNPTRRKIPEFGLGAGFSTRDYDAAEKIRLASHEMCELEEAMACFLAMMWLTRLGQPTAEESQLTNFAHPSDDDESVWEWSHDVSVDNNFKTIDLMGEWGLVDPIAMTVFPKFRQIETDPL